MVSKIDSVKDKLILIEGWARDGLTDAQIAKNLGIAYSTFCEYKKKDSEILEALKKGKEVIDYEVENALLKSAMGYEAEEVIYERRKIARDEYELVPVKIIKKQIPPNPTSLIYWLKNRRPDKWREKQLVEVDTSKVDELLNKIRDEAKW